LTKGELIEIIQRILNTDIDLSFLLQVKEDELEKLVAAIRECIEQVRK
jgi:hypothetical protein